MGPRAVTAAAAILALSTPAAARANCAYPTTYDLAVDGSTVTVQPTGPAERGCPDEPEGLLRQHVATGETVRLADFCAPARDEWLGAAYVDECVQPGRYRYGFAVPFACVGASCGTYRFAEVEVTAPLAAGCTRSDGSAAPAPVAPAAWSAENQRICGYAGAAAEDGGLGCGTVASGAGAVALVDALALGLGLALLRRRARARRA